MYHLGPAMYASVERPGTHMLQIAVRASRRTARHGNKVGHCPWNVQAIKVYLYCGLLDPLLKNVVVHIFEDM